MFTDLLDVDIGAATKASDYDALADNPEWLRDKANQEHDFDISTGDGSHKDISFASGSVSITVLDDMWIGLGAAAGRIVFDSTPTPDTVAIKSANLLLDSGAVVDFNAGDVTLTHSANVLTLAGGTFVIGNTTFDSNTITQATGAALNIALSSAAGDDFTVDTTKLVVEGDTGKVGIGTASPDEELHIASMAPRFILQDTDTNAAGEHWYFENLGGTFAIGESTDASGTWASLEDRLTILTGGNVGIGIAAPANPLHVYEDSADTAAAGVRIEQDGTGDAALHFELTGVEEFSMGLDNTDNVFHISNSASLGTNDSVTINASQEVFMPTGLTVGSTTAPETDLLVENDLWIGGDDANANRSGGMNAAPANLVINNDVASGNIFFRAKDAGITTTYNTTDSGQDDMLVMAKNNSGGGVKQYWMGGDTADTTMNEVLAIGGTASTTHTTAGRALLEFSVYEVSSGALAAITSDGNVFGIRDNGGSLLLLDEDGDLFIDGTSSAMDFKDDGITPRDDIAMLSALDYVRDPGSVYRTEWEDFVSVKEPDLIAANILGGPVAEGGMLNLTGLAQLHTGGIRQLERKKADRIELAREVEQRELLEATVAEQQVLLLEAHDIIERLSHQLEEGKE